MPDEPVRAMRRRLPRRSQLVSARSRVKNEVHAVLVRCLKGRPPASDLFGRKGRAWLGELELPAEERETVDAGLRQIAFLDSEIAEVERLIALQAMQWPQIGRLMTVPGVNLVVAATFLAAVGDIRRFPTTNKLVGYLGLDPRVRQSGDQPAKHGRVSKQGSANGRHALVEAAWSAVRQPGPLRAFYQRVRARRGHQIAIVASARKLACLFWCMLTGGEDYAYAQPSLTRKKLRRLDLTAGAPRRRARRRSGRPTTPCARPNVRSPNRPSSPTGATSPTGERPGRQRRARVRHRGTHPNSPRRAKAAWQTTAPNVCASLRQSPTPNTKPPTQQPTASRPLDFIRRAKRQSRNSASISGLAGGRSATLGERKATRIADSMSGADA